MWPLAGLALLMLPALAVVKLEADHATKILPEIEGAQRALAPAVAVIAAARRLALAIEDAERAERSYVLTGNAAYFVAYRRHAAQVAQRLARLKRLTAAEPDQKRRLALLDRLIAARLAALDRVVTLRARHEADAARGLVDGEAGFDEMAIISGAIDNLIAAERRPVEQSQRQAVAAARRSARSTLLASFVAAGATLLIGGIWAVVVWYGGRVRARLRDNETRYRAMFEDVTDYAIFMLDTMGRVANWSAGAERIFGYRAREILGRHFSCLYEEADAEAKLPDRQLGTAVADGRAVVEIWQRRKDSARFRADTVITALHDARGKVRGFCVIARAVGERAAAPLPAETPPTLVSSR